MRWKAARDAGQQSRAGRHGAGGTSAAARPDAAKAAIAHARAELMEIAAMLANPQPGAKRERAKVVKVRPESDSLFPM